jgi:hypothetical protein
MDPRREPTVEEPDTPKARRAPRAITRPMNVPPRAPRRALPNEEPELRLAKAKPTDVRTVEFNRESLNPQVKEMLKHLRPSTTPGGAAEEESLLRTLARADSATKYLDLYERFPNRVIRKLRNPQSVNTQMRRLLNDYEAGKIVADITDDQVMAPPTPSEPRGRSAEPKRVRMDAPDDADLQRALPDIMEDVDQSMLPKDLQEPDQAAMAVELLQMKRAYNATVEQDPKRARRVAEEQTDKVVRMQEKLERETAIVPDQRREFAQRGLKWLMEAMAEYVKNLQRNTRGQPVVIRMTKKDEEVAGAVRERSRSPSKSSSSKPSSMAKSSQSAPKAKAIADAPKAKAIADA